MTLAPEQCVDRAEILRSGVWVEVENWTLVRRLRGDELQIRGVLVGEPWRVYADETLVAWSPLGLDRLLDVAAALAVERSFTVEEAIAALGRLA